MAVRPKARAERWWRLEGPELAGQVTSICDALERGDEYRKARYVRALSLYEGRKVSLDDDSYFAASGRSVDLPPLYNLIRSACDTAQADIAGRQKPKPMFMTTGADWKARRRAKKLDKFVEAQLNERQGCYADAWQLLLDCFHDSTKIGDGLAKVWADIERKKVRIERVLPWEIHVDPRECRYGDPQNLFHVYGMERDLALELFCNVEGDDEGNERRRIAIETAGPRKSSNENARVVSEIRVCEAWRLPISDDIPGKHAIVIGNETMYEGDWKRAEFPFLKLTWGRDTVGWWGTGIAGEGETQQLQVNETAERLASRIRVCSTRRTYFNPDTAKKEDLEVGGEDEVLIPVKDMSQIPREEPVNPASQAEFEWLNLNIQKFYETLGVSQMTANSQKPPGVTAAVAMQTLNDIQTVRFLPKARAYEMAFVTLGRLCVAAADEIAEAHGGYLVKWPGKRFISELDWKDVSLEEDMYSIRVAPVSQYSRDPAAILEMAQELRGSGDISRETFLQMIGLPDLEEMLNKATSEQEYLEELLGRYLDSTNTDELAEAGGYEAPEPYIGNKAAAMALCVSTYWEAKRDKAPEFCLELLRRYMSQLDKLMQPPPAPPAQVTSPMGPAAPVPMPPAPGAQMAA